MGGNTYREPAVFAVQYHDGSGWVDAARESRPAPNYNRVAFAPVEARRWRVLVEPTAGYGVGVKELQLFGPVSVEQPGEVGGEVPATLSLTINGPASFGAFTPGVARDYETTRGANVISTAGEATLTVRDPAGNGRRVNGSFALREPVHANGAPVGGDALVLRSYPGPVSNDASSIALRQSIGANEPLRTGTYSKALTFTLSTTTP